MNSNTQTKNLPRVLLTDKFNRFKSKPNTMVVSSDRYLGISSSKQATNRIGDFNKTKLN